jgi:hypothetical protein
MIGEWSHSSAGPQKQPPGIQWTGSLGSPWVDLEVFEKSSLAQSLVTVPTELSRIRNLQQVRRRLWNALTVRRILRDTADWAQTTTQLACRLWHAAFVRLYLKTPLSKRCRRADLAEEAVVLHPIPSLSNIPKQDTRRKKASSLWLACQQNWTQLTSWIFQTKEHGAFEADFQGPCRLQTLL